LIKTEPEPHKGCGSVSVFLYTLSKRKTGLSPDNDYLSGGGFWQKQHHIYDSPLYYIDYCIAGTNALAYKVWMDEDFQGAWKSYMHLAKESASKFFDELSEIRYAATK